MPPPRLLEPRSTLREATQHHAPDKQTRSNLAQSTDERDRATEYVEYIFGQTILDYGPTSNGASDYRALAREVEAMSTTPQAVSVTINPAIDESALKASTIQNPEVAA